MDFALKQLKNMGWTEGKGLGMKENGIIKPITPNVQLDTRGLGYNIADSLQLKNQWWTEAYNAASKGLKPEFKITTVGVVIKPKSGDEKYDSDNDAHNNIVYNQHFVHAGTMMNNADNIDDDNIDSQNSKIRKSITKKIKKKNKKEKMEIVEMQNKNSLVSDNNNIDDHHNNEKYSKKLLNFNEIFEKNGQKITCHKAARLGIKMTGKMKRIEEQEKEFLMKQLNHHNKKLKKW